MIEAEHKSQCNSVVQISSASTTKTDKAYSPSYIRQTNACPAHPNTSLMLTSEAPYVNNVGKIRKSIDLPMDQQRLLLKQQQTLEKSSSTNCTSCGRSLEKEQQQTNNGNSFARSESEGSCPTAAGSASKGRAKRRTSATTDNLLTERTNGVAIDRENISKSGDRKNASKSPDRNGSKIVEPNKGRPQKIKHRKCLFAIRRSKPANENNGLNGDKADESADYEAAPDADCRAKKNKRLEGRLKKKSRTPDTKQSEQLTLPSNTQQPLLESTRRKDRESERNNNLNNVNNLEFIDQIDRASLCEQCLNNLLNNNNDEQPVEDRADSFALECDPYHNTDELKAEPACLNCRPTNFKADFKSEYRSSSSASSRQDRKPSNDQRLKNRTINLNIAAQQITGVQPSTRKSTQSSIRERKASITLGVIMCAFIL